MTGRLRKAAAGLVVIGAPVLVAVALTGPGGRDRGPSEVLGSQRAQVPVITCACDVDGVGVSWDTSYTGAEPAGYKVVQASLTGVSPTCAGATVNVRLLDGDTVLATTSVPASGATVTVPFSSPPAAQRVRGVAVEIAGGSTPVPTECQGRTFDRFAVLTDGADASAGSGSRDLVYGLGGADSLRGGNKDDCLVGQGGNDVLSGENHADVLVGGDGDDTLDGGNHADVLIGGDGNDLLRGGNGTDRCIGGAGTNTFVSCEVRE